jgi:hypothetical protein
VHTRPPREPDCRISLDEDLIATCRHFRRKLLEWIEQVAGLGIESYAEDEEVGRPLLALRVEWGTALEILSSLESVTVDGAEEKLKAARAYLTFSGEADGSAIELLALAAGELDRVSHGHPTPDQTQPSRRTNAQGRFWWLEWLTRRG